MPLALDPGPLFALALAGGLYWRALRVLRRRGFSVPAAQQAAWWLGLACVAGGLLSPIDALSEKLLSAHMVQHLLIADLAAPLLLIGLRTPVLVFFLPAAVLVPLSRARRLRRVLRFLRRPLVALPLFVLVLYGWHLSFAFEAALHHPWVHVLQHQSFVVIGLLVWWAAIEPQRRRTPGELWKAGHILGARLAGMMLGMAFLVMRTPVYAGAYGDSAERFGLSPLADQQTAGGIMLSVDLVIMLVALSFFFWRAAADHDLAQAAAGPAAPGAEPVPGERLPATVGRLPADPAPTRGP